MVPHFTHTIPSVDFKSRILIKRFKYLLLYCWKINKVAEANQPNDLWFWNRVQSSQCEIEKEVTSGQALLTGGCVGVRVWCVKVLLSADLVRCLNRNHWLVFVHWTARILWDCKEVVFITAHFICGFYSVSGLVFLLRVPSAVPSP